MGWGLPLQRSFVAAALTAALLAGWQAYDLVATQRDARQSLEREFTRRATLAADLTAAALVSGTADIRTTFSGPASRLPHILRQWEGESTDPAAVVLGDRGQILAAWPDRAAGVELQRRPETRRALAGRPSVSNLLPAGRDGAPSITLALPFEAKGHGRRVVAYTTSATVIQAFAASYLAGAPAVRDARAYLVDASGLVLGTALDVEQGVPLPDRALRAAIVHGRSGRYGEGQVFTTAALPGLPWRVVFAARRADLMAPVEGGQSRTAWQAFAGFVLALLGLLALGVRTARRSSELASARERELAAQKLARERLHDPLTGLPNRALFLDRVDQAIALARRTGGPLAVLFIDVDRFKRINDSLGHQTGDELLVSLAHRLRETARPGDTVCRFGGDEFLVLCPDLADVDAATSLAGRVRASVERPFVLGGRTVHVTCCIGLALHGADHPVIDAGTLIREADAAMDRAKAHGHGHLQMFDEDLHEDAVRRLDTEVALRAAIAGGELTLHYQPIVRLPDGEPEGVEALVRWERPGVGLVPPMDFIGIAEEAGLIDRLGEWVLRTAMAEVGRWAADGLVPPEFRVSVNVSAWQLNTRFVKVVEDALRRWGRPPGGLCLELTESAVARDPDAARATLAALRDLGVAVAIDDFGVGQTSLGQLSGTLPVQVLKVDRGFVSQMDDPRQRAIVAAIAPMADAMGMSVIAEGVETIAQADELERLGYRFAQGYLFGRPVDAAAARAALAAGGRAGRQVPAA